MTNPFRQIFVVEGPKEREFWDFCSMKCLRHFWPHIAKEDIFISSNQTFVEDFGFPLGKCVTCKEDLS